MSTTDVLPLPAIARVASACASRPATEAARLARDLLHQRGVQALIDVDPDGTVRVDIAEQPELAATLEALLATAVQRDRHRRQAERIEERFTTNQRISGVGSYDWHIPSDTNRWTDSLFRIYGEEPGAFEPSYAEFMARVHPDDRERIQAVHQKALETHGTYQMHERIVRPDGEVRTLWSMGEVIIGELGAPVRMVGVCEDVTEKLLEQTRLDQLREATAREQERRSTALELNDNVVQGLTAVAWALEANMTAEAGRAAHRTLEAAREMLARLLPLGDGLAAGDLVRSAPAPRVLDHDT